jgi:hypothetical protein
VATDIISYTIFGDSRMKVYTYWKLIGGTYVVAKNGEAMWEVNKRWQAIQDCKQLETYGMLL